MKKNLYTRTRRGGRSYRAIGTLTVLHALISLSLRFLVSSEACLLAALYGAVALSLAVIVSAGVKAALEVERERTEGAGGNAGVPLRRF